ncbi:MAG TPA: hypothetical protein VG826_26445 [Pirellulales bacterium]|nr:hypothetical protein [Pirellulales bacterium]
MRRIAGQTVISMRATAHHDAADRHIVTATGETRLHIEEREQRHGRGECDTHPRQTLDQRLFADVHGCYE